MVMATATIWDQVLSRIEGQVGKHSFSTWFKPTSLLTDGGNSLSIRVPNLLFVEWLPKHYSVVLAEALREVGRADAKLVFVPDAAGASADDNKASPFLPVSGLGNTARPADHLNEPDVPDNSPTVGPRAGSLIPRYTF